MLINHHISASIEIERTTAGCAISSINLGIDDNIALVGSQAETAATGMGGDRLIHSQRLCRAQGHGADHLRERFGNPQGAAGRAGGEWAGSVHALEIEIASRHDVDGSAAGKGALARRDIDGAARGVQRQSPLIGDNEIVDIDVVARRQGQSAPRDATAAINSAVDVDIDIGGNRGTDSQAQDTIDQRRLGQADIHDGRVKQEKATSPADGAGIDQTAEIEGLLPGNFHPAAIATLITTAGIDHAAIDGSAVGPDDGFAPVPVLKGAYAERSALLNCGGVGILLYSAALPATADMHAVAGKLPAGINTGASGEMKVAAENADVTTVVTTGGQRTGDFHAAVAPAQDNLSVLLADPVGSNAAVHVDDRVENPASILGGQQKCFPAIGNDLSGLPNQCIDRLAIRAMQRTAVLFAERQVDQAVAIEIDGEGVCGPEHHFAQLGLNDAVVTHVGGYQRHQAAFRRGDAAGIADAGTGFARLREIEFASKKVTISQVGRGGDQAADIDSCPIADDHSIGIDEQNLTIGIQSPQ